MADLAIVRCAPSPNVKGVVTASKLTTGTESVSKDIYILMQAIESIAEYSIGGLSASLVPEAPEGAFVAATATIGVVLL